MGGFHDSTLPAGVDMVELTVHCLPSVAIVIATFVLAEEAADLSDLLRADYHSGAFDARVLIRGPLGRVRARVPWSRPRDYSVSSKLTWPDGQKRKACQERVKRIESTCWTWFTSRFPGRFSRAQLSGPPAIRLLLTEAQQPFLGQDRWLDAVSLDWSPDVYRSTDPKGWAVRLRDWGENDLEYQLTAAARRSDAARSPRVTGPPEEGESNWYLGHRFHSEQSSLAARWGLLCLLKLYGDSLSKLRDRAANSDRRGGTVKEAKDLNRYLVGDGLDAVAVTSDVLRLTEDSSSFGWNVPDYTQDLSGLSDVAKTTKPAELVEVLQSNLGFRAQRLRDDLPVMAESITASAQLRQAITNTQLQRRIVVLTLLVAAIAIASLVVAVASSHTAPPKRGSAENAIVSRIHASGVYYNRPPAP